jgi:3-deoxy-D-manno-octulosonate 8-phosphate phosphatase (KDO 8-P phosphatase)
MESNVEKAKAIRLLILDVDGILTSGLIYYDDQETMIKGFHIHDGLGIKLLQKAGIHVAIITAKHSEAVQKRMRDLNIEHVYMGYEEKLPAYQDLKQKLGLTDNEIAYMGDDLPDLPLLRRVKFALTAPHAPVIIQQHVDYVSKKKAGKGAVREACEFILQAQGKLDSMIESYLLK